MSLPTIAIVVPSFNQAAYIRETLQSLVDQEYPKLKVIIQDGGSTDGSIAIAEEFVTRYPEIFGLFVEKDAGQADALNRGFAKAKADILGFLNSDDTYFPKILHRVASEIDRDKRRFIVMGRCLFTGENSRYVGVEHPAEFISHFEHLAIWKRGYNTIPQPSVFWHRDVWDRAGGFDIQEHHALDYDLFCRFSRHYRIHRVDELWSTYRMHDSSKSSQRTEDEVLELTVGVSKKYWGSLLSLTRWRCEISYWLYRGQFHDRARHHARIAESAFRSRQHFVALKHFLLTFRYSPPMACNRLIHGLLVAKSAWLMERIILRHEGFTGRYADAWIGPIYRQVMAVPTDGKKLIVVLSHAPQGHHKKVRVKLFINGVMSCIETVDEAKSFFLSADASTHQGKEIMVELRSSSYFIPSMRQGVGDDRRLSLMLNEAAIQN